MRLRAIVVLLLLGLGSFQQSYGAQPQISRSHLTNLIQQPLVAVLHRDQNGLLWIGTQNGLYSFDGGKLTTFNSEKSNPNWIPEADIRGIGEDSDGNLLVATFGAGLLTWNRSSRSFESTTKFGSTTETHLIRMHISKLGGIWLASRDKVFLYDPSLGSTPNWLLEESAQTIIGRPINILEDAKGNVFVGGTFGLAKINPYNKTVESLIPNENEHSKNNVITALELARDGNIIFGTNTGIIAIYDTDRNVVLNSTLVGNGRAIYISDFLLHDDRLFIGSDRGLYESDLKLSHYSNISDSGSGLTSNDVYSLYADGEYILIGTYNGLNILSFSPFELFNSKNSNVSDNVMVFEEDSEKRVWIGTYNGLFYHNKNGKYHENYSADPNNPRLSDDRVTAIESIGSELWLGFYHGGLQIIDTRDGSSHIPTLDGSKDFFVIDILASDNGSTVWVATYDHGLIRLNRNNGISSRKMDNLPENTVNLLFRTRGGRLLIGAVNKLYEYDLQADAFTHLDFKFSSEVRSPFIYSIAQNNAGDLWIGTKDQGLYLWKVADQRKGKPSLQRVGISSSLTHASIYGIEIDPDGNLWCSTQNGIVKLDSAGNLIRGFTKADGLQDNDFTSGASFTSSIGAVYFGGPSGYNTFDPKSVTIDRSPPTILLTNIQFPTQDFSTSHNANQFSVLHLSHKDHFVTFEFSVLDFLSPGKNHFRYKLENFDPDWVDSGSRNTATYTNLPAGKYVFRVQGANSAGIWNRDGISLAVRVLPPPWFTWWAFCIYGAIFLGLGWVVHRIYYSYLVERRSAQMAVEMYEAEVRADDDMQEQMELHDELIESAYEHNTTILSLIDHCITVSSDSRQKHIDRHLIEGSIKRIAAFGCLENCLQYHAGGPVVNLHKYCDLILADLLQDPPVNPESIITINEVSDQLFPAQIASPLAVILFELLENCVQHALAPQSPANYIHVKLTNERIEDTLERRLDISVQDSGAGIPENLLEAVDGSSGLAIVKSLVEQLDGNLQLSISNGSIVAITIPFNDLG